MLSKNVRMFSVLRDMHAVCRHLWGNEQSPMFGVRYGWTILHHQVFNIKWGHNCIMNNSRLVYSTEKGRVCPNCGHPVKKCRCKKGKSSSPKQVLCDGILRIRREVKGRKGKGVTTITGFDLDARELKEKAAGLKRLCGTGGSVKEGTVIIQGDHRNTLLAELQRQGYNVKLAGG
jgi:translation initiation factor 1